MDRCPFWVWFKHRVEEARGDVITCNDDNKVHIHQHNDILHFHTGVYKRTWGGIPIFYFFGDFHQLPPFSMKAVGGLNSLPKLHTSDLQGLFSFREFLNCAKDGTKSCSVVMDEVSRQSDPTFKSNLHNIREGWMGGRSDNLLLKR